MKFQMGMLKEGAEDNLVMLASGGNSLAKNTLMSRYQPFVTRLVNRLKVENADDVAQDIMLKVILSLHQFESRSLFTTWLYRITINHVLQLKKKSKQIMKREFDHITQIERSHSDADEEKLKQYMAGMMTCLQPDQRAALILGNHFNLDHNAAAEVLMITPVNFRKRLSRARKDLQQWTNNQCSLLGAKGCSCTKKKKYFIDQGWVDPATEKFTQERLKNVGRILQARCVTTAQALSIT